MKQLDTDPKKIKQIPTTKDAATPPLAVAEPAATTTARDADLRAVQLPTLLDVVAAAECPAPASSACVPPSAEPDVALIAFDALVVVPQAPAPLPEAATTADGVIINTEMADASDANDAAAVVLTSAIDSTTSSTTSSATSVVPAGGRDMGTLVRGWWYAVVRLFQDWQRNLSR